MVYKIYWSEPAVGDLEEIGDYIAQDDPQAAVKVGNEIISHVDILENFPLIGSFFPRYSKGPIHEILCFNYRIFYRVSEKSKLVEILRIWHGSRDEPHVNELYRKS